MFQSLIKIVIFILSICFCTSAVENEIEQELISSANLEYDRVVSVEELRKRINFIEDQKITVSKRIELAGMSSAVLSSLKRSVAKAQSLLIEKQEIDPRRNLVVELKILDLEEELEQCKYFSKKWFDLKDKIDQLQSELDLYSEIELCWEELTKDVEEFVDFVRERILWARSHRPIHEYKGGFQVEYLNHFSSLLKGLWPSVVMCMLLSFVASFILNKGSFYLCDKFLSSKQSLENLVLLGLVMGVSGICLYSCTYFLQKYFLISGEDRVSLGLFLYSLYLYHAAIFVLKENGIFSSLYVFSNDVQKILRNYFKALILATPFFTIGLSPFQVYDLRNLLTGTTLIVMFIYLTLISFHYGVKLFQSRDNLDSRHDFEKGSIHLTLFLSIAVVHPVLLLLVIYGYRESSIYIFNRWMVTICIYFMWSYSLGLMWYFRRFLRKEAIENAREVLDAGGESDVKELLSADREVGRVFRVIGIFILISGLWLTWKEALSAVKVFQGITVWTIEGNMVTIFDLLIAVFICYFGNVLHKNLRSSLDIYIFGPLGMTEGNSYAIATILRYAILAIFTSLACKQIGLDWENIQWFVAAFSVGLGFGMQEIFANFISGLILLTERPIRVGDIISLSNIWGKVECINIRSTTITNWDHQEVIIPNKELITGQLTNWTLSNKQVRVVISVGVAYDSDIDKVKAILLEIADKNKRVIADPEPKVALMKFGDSSIDFDMDVYISEFNSEDDLDDLRDEVNSEIFRKFKEENIEIPFPQRVIHVEKD